MHNGDDILARTTKLLDLIEKRTGAKAPDLEKAVQKVGHGFPRGIRKRVAQLVEAEAMAGHPKLARRVDRVAFDHAYTQVSAYLGRLDLAEQRRTRFLNRLADIVFKLLVVIVLFLVVLNWRGLL